MSEGFDPELIAPCGMNCAICLAYLREKNKCPGCRKIKIDKSVSRAKCKVKNCDEIAIKKKKFCYECDNLPCQRMKSLDKRYRTKYDMSMLENLEYIKQNGLDKFVKKERERWKCPKCGGVICVHRKKCYTCEIN